jgi:hypothetical protein
MAEARRCPACGGELKDDDRFCGRCGQSAHPEPTSEARERTRRRVPLPAAVFVLLVAGAAVPIFLRMNRPDPAGNGSSETSESMASNPTEEPGTSVVPLSQIPGFSETPEDRPLDVSGMGIDPRGIGEEEPEAPPREEASSESEPGAEYLEKGYELGAQGRFEEALVWYRKAADAGNLEGMVQCGSTAVTVADDILEGSRQALAWYRKAAERGHVFAMYLVGDHCMMGVGLDEPDYEQALVWLRRAADKGSLDAMVSLAWMYDQGLGVPADPAASVEWYRRAARAGNFTAQERLREKGLRW